MRLFRLSLGTLLAVLLPAFPAFAADPPVNGYLYEVDGQPVLHVWGSHYEMGYAHGALLGEQIMESMQDYVLRLLPPSIYSAMHVIAPLLFALPDEYREEVQGMVDGIFASGANPFIEELGRYIDAGDLIFCNAVGDIGAMACSSQLAWDDATAGDPALDGETALVRNLDWALAGPNPYLLPEGTVVITYDPTDAGEQAVAAVTFPGFFGCLSCMNESGLTATVNIAHNGIDLWKIRFTQRYYHSGVTLRQALHARDWNGDGAGDLYDVLDDLAAKAPSGAVVVNVAQPRDTNDGNPGVVAEVDSAGFTTRTPADDPEFFGNILIATNHLRKLRPPAKCERYATMHDLIEERDGRLTLDEMWWIERQVIQDRFLSTTAQTMYFLPFRRELGVSFSTADTYSPDKEPVVLSWEDLTMLPPGLSLDDDADGDDMSSPADTDGDDDDEPAVACW